MGKDLSIPKINLWCQPAKDGVYNAFPVDPTKNQRTAKVWAQGLSYQNFPNDPLLLTLDNQFDHVTVERIEVRDQGGRAYKTLVQTPEGTVRVDFREPEMMDVIEHVGIQAGGRLGILPTTFTFVQAGSQIRLARLESATVKEYAAAQERKKVKLLTPSKLIPFHVYSHKNPKSRERYFYIGEAYVPAIECDNVVTSYYLPQLTPVQINYTGKTEKRYLFISYTSYGDPIALKDIIEDFFTGKLNNNIDRTYWTTQALEKTTLHIDEGAALDIPIHTPTELIRQFRQTVVSTYKKYIVTTPLKDTNHIAHRNSYYTRDAQGNYTTPTADALVYPPEGVLNTFLTLGSLSQFPDQSVGFLLKLLEQVPT